MNELKEFNKAQQKVSEFFTNNLIDNQSTIKIRGFEKISDCLLLPNYVLPHRKTFNSAGYDFVAPFDIIIKPTYKRLFNFLIYGKRKPVKINTGIKAYMLPSEFLGLFIRSSLALNYQLMLLNNVPIIDSDYYNNSKNEGEIIVSFYNFSNKTAIIKKGESFCQGIFLQYGITDNDHITNKTKRDGGIGSTNKNE